jgi:hypothetical protein
MFDFNRLDLLRAHRDALDEEIRLVEAGISKAAYDCAMHQQLLAVNEARRNANKQPVSMSQFLAGDTGGQDDKG